MKAKQTANSPGGANISSLCSKCPASQQQAAPNTGSRSSSCAIVVSLALQLLSCVGEGLGDVLWFVWYVNKAVLTLRLVLRTLGDFLNFFGLMIGLLKRLKLYFLKSHFGVP